MAIRRKKTTGGGETKNRAQSYQRFEQIMGANQQAIAEVVAKARGDVQSAIKEAQAAVAEAEQVVNRAGDEFKDAIAASQASTSASVDTTMESTKRAETATRSTVQAVLERLNNLSGNFATPGSGEADKP